MNFFIQTLIGGSSGGVITNPEPSTPTIGNTVSPLRVLVIGDSIARGTNEEYSYSGDGGNADPDTLFEWNEDNELVEVVRDVENGYGGSPYPGMANKIKTDTGFKMHVLNTGYGGSEFSPNGDTHHWTLSGEHYNPMKTRANTYLTNQEVSKFDIIRITLGVNDSNGDAQLEDIEADAKDLIARLRTDFPNTPILMNQIHTGNTRRTAIRGYINDIISEYDFVYLGEDLSEYSEYYFDGLHLNQAGNDLIGEQDAIHIKNLLNI